MRHFIREAEIRDEATESSEKMNEAFACSVDFERFFGLLNYVLCIDCKSHIQIVCPICQIQ